MTPPWLDAVLVLVFTALFAVILYAFGRHPKQQEAERVHWRGLIALALLGGLMVTFAFNLLERRVEEPEGEPGELLLLEPTPPD